MTDACSQPTGFLLIDKPEDWTSHDVVGYLRGVTKIKKIGHAGTLDPFATGLLIVAIGRAATKRIDEFKAVSKTYEAAIMLGAVSNTQDRTGTIVELENKKEKIKDINRNKIETVLHSFLDEQEQLSPMFSAKKVKGKKLYELARKGIEIERQPHTITLHDIQLNDISLPIIRITATVSTGTYIRTLAHDIGQALGVGAYCKELRRISIGEYSVDNAVGPKDMNKDNWRERLFSI